MLPSLLYLGRLCVLLRLTCPQHNKVCACMCEVCECVVCVYIVCIPSFVHIQHDFLGRISACNASDDFASRQSNLGLTYYMEFAKPCSAPPALETKLLCACFSVCYTLADCALCCVWCAHSTTRCVRACVSECDVRVYFIYKLFVHISRFFWRRIHLWAKAQMWVSRVANQI